MTDFADKGFAVIDLIQPRFAADLWRDIDKEEIRKLLLDTDSDAHWKTLENFPRKRSLITFTREVDSNMYKCWERYGKKTVKPKIVEQDLMVFLRTQKRTAFSNDKFHIVVMVPLTTVSQHEGLPTLMEGSHREKNVTSNKSCDLIVQPGQALMFDTRLAAHIPEAGGGVLVATIYDMTDT